MAFKRSLAQRLFNITKISTQTLTNCRISSSSIKNWMPQNSNETNIAPDPGDNGLFRRFLHKTAIFQPTSTPNRLPIPTGGNLIEKLREIDFSRDRMRFEGLLEAKTSPGMAELTVEDARKLLRVVQLEMVKSKLRAIGKAWIPYSEFVRACGEGCSDAEQGPQLAKMLDDSGNVIVFRNLVCLRPEQVTKAMENLIPLPEEDKSDPRRKELEEMETQKAAIDKEADSLVKRELWGGLAYLVVQTVGFMRLTFWELSWDVMEPICFYVTSMYFMAGYTFFLRTCKEPSFEGFYQSRFTAKQKHLMKRGNFNVDRYNELLKLFKPKSLATGS